MTTKLAIAALIVPASLAVAALGACSKDPSAKLANRVETAAEARATALESDAAALKAKADALASRADTVRDTGKSRADAIKAADMDVANMTQAQRDAIVANQAAAVR